MTYEDGSKNRKLIKLSDFIKTLDPLGDDDITLEVSKIGTLINMARGIKKDFTSFVDLLSLLDPPPPLGVGDIFRLFNTS